MVLETRPEIYHMWTRNYHGWNRNLRWMNLISHGVCVWEIKNWKHFLGFLFEQEGNGFSVKVRWWRVLTDGRRRHKWRCDGMWEVTSGVWWWLTVGIGWILRVVFSTMENEGGSDNWGWRRRQRWWCLMAVMVMISDGCDGIQRCYTFLNGDDEQWCFVFDRLQTTKKNLPLMRLSKQKIKTIPFHQLRILMRSFYWIDFHGNFEVKLFV